MAIRLYNTLSRQKEPLKPIDPGNVRLYVCGPTVYDHIHIGNARPIIVFDVLFRLLRHLAAKGEWDGGKGKTKVTYARNITDVDDKINARAAERGIPIGELTETTTRQFHDDIAALGVLEPTIEPRATDHIGDMKAIIETLVDRGYAYVAQDHVLFDVKSMPDYGRLSNRSLDEMQAGARVEVASYKRDPMDFVLWKPSKPGEPAWPSPCRIEADGRPGWHIECSAMADKLLWQDMKSELSEAGLARPHEFDIHGGGIDLVFPHHENEIAQSRCAHGTDVMANIFMHNGFLQVEGEKMSKSEGNFVTVHELLATDKFGGRIWPGEVLRLAMLMTHYREPINWSIDRLTEARHDLCSWADAVIEATSYPYPIDFSDIAPDDDVIAALCDDLNTPRALTRLRQLRKPAEGGDIAAKKRLGSTLSWLGLYRPEYHAAYDFAGVDGVNTRHELLSKYRAAVFDARAIVLNEYVWHATEGSDREASRATVERRINELDPRMKNDGIALELHKHCDVTLIPKEERARQEDDFEERIKSAITARNEARAAKNWAEADRIRDELAAHGIQLKDAKDPATGEIVTSWEMKR